MKLLVVKKTLILKQTHPLLIKSKILSFQPLSARGSPVTQKLSQEQ